MSDEKVKGRRSKAIAIRHRHPPSPPAIAQFYPSSAINTQSAASDDGVKVERVRIRYIQSKKMRQAVQNLSVRKLADDDDEEE